MFIQDTPFTSYQAWSDEPKDKFNVNFISALERSVLVNVLPFFVFELENLMC